MREEITYITKGGMSARHHWRFLRREDKTRKKKGGEERKSRIRDANREFIVLGELVDSFRLSLRAKLQLFISCLIIMILGTISALDFRGKSLLKL